MSDPSLEKCKNLAGWGLPQDIARYEQYWGPRKLGNGYRVYRAMRSPLPSDFDWYDNLPRYRIPALEELMDFAEEIFCDYCDSSYANRAFRLEKYVGADIAPQPFVATFLGFKGRDIDSRWLAVYKLIDKVENENAVEEALDSSSKTNKELSDNGRLDPRKLNDPMSHREEER